MAKIYSFEAAKFNETNSKTALKNRVSEVK